jgi:hypothetical protein
MPDVDHPLQERNQTVPETMNNQTSFTAKAAVAKEGSLPRLHLINEEKEFR